MRLTVIGCAGSYPGPDSPASCYLVEAPHEGRTHRLVIDLGNGALSGLQRAIGLRDIDTVCISHLHADHCLDMCGLYVASKYDPAGTHPSIPVLAPEGAGEYLACAYGAGDGHGMHEQFDFAAWVEREPVQAGPFTVTAMLVDHPVPAYAIKVATADATLVYSGDTGPTEALVDFIAGADVFLAEASFVESAENPPNLHMTGAEAGDFATRAGVKRLLITHIPAWNDRGEVAGDVKTTWDGACELVQAGDVYHL